jgi:Spy/CpxP family protein refolding chaperone
MMRFFGKLVLTLGALALLASPAVAQGRGGPGGGAAGFLMAPNVQKDLKLTDAQVRKVQETLRENRERHQGDYSALRDASPDVRWAKMATLNETVSDEVKKALSFSAEQSKRFDQISLQAHGLQAFAHATVAEKLNLTNDQKSKIREIVEATRTSFAGAVNKDASEQERTEARNKRAAAQKENLAKVHAMLTDDQNKAWNELTGEPIVIQYPARRPSN